MDTIFMNWEYTKTFNPHKLLLKRNKKQTCGETKKSVLISNLSIYYTWKNIKSPYKNNKVKISATTWNDIFKFTNGSYSLSDIQGYFEYIIKNMEQWINNPSIKRCISKLKIVLRLKIRLDIILKFWQLKQQNYLEALKIK